MRRTIVVHNAFAARITRCEAARDGFIGDAVMTIAQLASRLAGGFLQPPSHAAILTAIDEISLENLGELAPIAELPGFRRAAAASIAKAWNAGIDFRTSASSNADVFGQANRFSGINVPDDPGVLRRFAAFAELENRIFSKLPPMMRTPTTIAAAAIRRAHLAPRLLGEIEIRGHTEIEPVWRDVLTIAAQHTSVRWIAGAAHVPAWLEQTLIHVVRGAATSPQVIVERCADPMHEALEAFRWARALITERGIAPNDIAIASASCDEFDDAISALVAASDIPVYRVAGERAVQTAAGQLAASLAELLESGCSRSRIVRFCTIAASFDERYAALTGAWFERELRDIPLCDSRELRRHIDDILTQKVDCTADDAPNAASWRTLKTLINTIFHGAHDAKAIGEALLPDAARALWQRALMLGPAQALGLTLSGMRVVCDDDRAPEFSVLWCSAASLASVHRPYVRLLGLTAKSWPRAASEDALLPRHIVPATVLDPLPMHVADRRDFDTILASTSSEVVCSLSRRDAAGKVTLPSSLLPHDCTVADVWSSRSSARAATHADRNVLDPSEFARDERACAALQTWHDWHSDAITPHDGKIRAEHPLMDRIMRRTHSATSLRMLLVDPIAFLWKYGFSWEAVEDRDDAFEIDNRDFGTLVHDLIDRAHRNGRDVTAAFEQVAQSFHARHTSVPTIIRQATLDEALRMATAALSEVPIGPAYSEVAFGGSRGGVHAHDASALPFNDAAAVTIPDTDIRITGKIDLLELSPDGTRARVTDFKTGSDMVLVSATLAGGSEVQRCLYASVIRSLLPDVTKITSRLAYLGRIESGTPTYRELAEPDAVLGHLTAALNGASRALRAGNFLSGAVSADAELDFARPGGEWYPERKAAAFADALPELAVLWSTK